MKDYNQMNLVTATIHNIYKTSLLNELSTFNNIHIKQSSKAELFLKSSERDPVHESVIKLKEDLTQLFKKFKINDVMFNNLEISKEEKPKFIINDLIELINRTSEEINYFIFRANELERYISKAVIELENKETMRKCYNFLEKFNFNRLVLAKFKRLKFEVLTTLAKNSDNLENLLNFTEFPNYHQKAPISDERIVFFVIYPSDEEEEFNERMTFLHAEKIQLSMRYVMYDKVNFERLDREINYIKKLISNYRKELTGLKRDNLLRFAALSEIVQSVDYYNWAERQFEDISLSRGMLNFFIPKGDIEEIRTKLKKKFGNNLTLDIKEIPRTNKKRKQNARDEPGEREISEQEIEETPTLMNHNPLIKPFEVITRLYGIPSYSEIDPTPFIAISFPLIFGLMFGDIGHGICLIISGIIGSILFRKKEGVRDLCWVIFYCGWGAIVGGLLYGEFFGMHEFLGIHLTPLLENPLEDIMSILKFAILIGVIHVVLGWVIQFFNYWKKGRKYLAFSDSFIKILLLLGGTYLILGIGFSIDAWLAPPFPILVVVIPGITLIVLKPVGKLFKLSYLEEESIGGLIGEGSIETFETFLSILSNISSYIRVLALALAHIALMVAIQAMISLIEIEGIVGQVLIITGFVFGNLIVIVLEGLLVFLNTIRLHFYEFFSKFYQGSGIEFVPFKLKNKFSVIEFMVESGSDAIYEEIEKQIKMDNVNESINRALEYIYRKYM